MNISRSRWRLCLFVFLFLAVEATMILCTFYEGNMKFKIQHKRKNIKDVMPGNTSVTIIDYQQSLKNEQKIPFPKSLAKYVQWHASMVKCLNNLSCKPSPPRILVWFFPDGKRSGVGDRMRGVQFALLLAIISERVLFVKWTDEPFPFEDVVVPSTFDWRMPKSISTSGWSLMVHHKWPLITCISCSGMTRKQNKDSMINDLTSPLQVNLSEGNLTEALNNIPNLYLITTKYSVRNLASNKIAMRNFQDLKEKHLSSFHLERLLLQMLFKPSSVVLSKLNVIIPETVRLNGYVAVHARTGYDFSEPETSNKRFQNLRSSENYIAQKFMKCALSVDSTGRYPIFVASDSLRFKQAMINVSSEWNRTIFYSDVPGLHVGLRDAGIPKNLSAEDSRRAFINVFVEFFGISQATKIINIRSYFSLMAYLIGKASLLKEISL